MEAMVMLCVSVLALLATLAQAQNLLNNPDFEEAFGQDNWYCVGCTLDQVADPYTGQYSGRTTARTATWGGVTQNVDVGGGRSYIFTAMIRFLNDIEGPMWHSVPSTVAVDFTTGPTQYIRIAILPYARVADSWIMVGGDFSVPQGVVTSARIYIEPQNSDINYLMDTASLEEIVHDPDWVGKANERIDQLRKRDVTFRINISPEYQPSDVQIQVNHTQHRFPFGCTVNADIMAGSGQTSQRYNQHFFNEFDYNWAVIENAMKWRDMEPQKGNINFERADRAIAVLEERGVPLRGHCIYWGVETWVPDWVIGIDDGEEVAAEVDRRIDYVVDYYKDNVVHWDVNNEQLHGDFFESRTGDPEFLGKTFDRAQGIDSDVKLFINDYSVISSSEITVAFRNQAQVLQQQGSPVYGAGVQGHFGPGPNTDLIHRRLDIVADAGLPIWVTELDVEDPNEFTKADSYEHVLRLFFSHPAVEGVLMWGFWDGAHWRPDASLVNGQNWQMNEAGRRYQRLMREEWATHAAIQPAGPEEDVMIRSFQGHYDLTVYYQGEVLHTQQYFVDDDDLTVDVDV